MIKLYRKIFFFIVPVLGLLLFFPENKRLRFINLENDCSNQSIWMYDRLYNNPQPVDIAFIGTSKSINGVNDEIITQGLYSTNVINLGYCRHGKNLYLPFLKNLLETKHPKKIFFEVSEYEPRYTHAMFPYIADEGDVFTAYPFYNPNLFSDMYTAMVYKTELVQQQLLGSGKQVPVSDKLFGYSASADTLSGRILDEAFARRYHQKDDQIPFIKPFKYAFPRHYLLEIAQLCKEAGVEFYFYYLPGYGYSYTEPTDAHIYRELAPLILPPRDIFENRNYWHDLDHLNQAGATAYSYWLVEQLKK